MVPKPIHVLFLCTANSARSILAEALLNHLGQGRFIAYSAGSAPIGKVNLYALETLKEMRVSAGDARSKSWDEFAANSAVAQSMDLVVTVCDNAAGEVCPVWSGHCALGHWGIPDPAAFAGGEETKRRAFRSAFDTLQLRIRKLVALPIEHLTKDQLELRLRDLGKLWPPSAPST